MKIYGNKQALMRLSEYAKNDRLPHSLLFFGDEGTGKRTLADYTAMLYFCLEKGDKPCMKCENCLRTEQHIHPDIVYVECLGLKAEILKEEILPGTHQKAVEGGLKIYIFGEFQLLNRECQNALLTFLEEPSPTVRFILTASNRNGILPTILSRTAAIQTFKLSVEECEAALSDKGIKNAKELALAYNGNLGSAVKAAKDKNAALYLDLAKEFCNHILNRNEYKALKLLLQLSQPKEDKRAPLRIIAVETEKIFHDGFVTAMGGKPSVSGCPELSEKAAKAFSPAVLNRIALETVRYSKIATENNFNSKITANALVSAVFGAMEQE
ncbi:MAG: DNA polymerase III subunit [Ruminiclostridium sp.]|nr:DNA polymerase III subunit [Ruminiclostridium sp.]